MIRNYCDKCGIEAKVNPLTRRPELQRMRLYVDEKASSENPLDLCASCIATIRPQIDALLKGAE